MEAAQEIDRGANNVSLIAAIGARDRALGKGGDLLWRIPGDLQRFKALTTGHPVVMGRKTWESLPEKFRPLPARTNIVITRDTSYAAPGAEVVPSFEAALAKAKQAEGAEEIFVIGGGEIYTLALPFATRLYLTLVEASAEADTFFPEYTEEFRVVSEERGESDLPHVFQTLERA